MVNDLWALQHPKMLVQIACRPCSISYKTEGNELLCLPKNPEKQTKFERIPPVGGIPFLNLNWGWVLLWERSAGTRDWGTICLFPTLQFLSTKHYKRVQNRHDIYVQQVCPVRQVPFPADCSSYWTPPSVNSCSLLQVPSTQEENLIHLITTQLWLIAPISSCE